MIRGIGVDIVNIARIEEALESRRERFLRRVFTRDEAAYSMARPRPAAHLAARFAAKEAVKKAAGARFRWTDIEVRNAPCGKPSVSVKGAGGDIMLRLSISHTDEYAVAFVTVEEKPL